MRGRMSTLASVWTGQCLKSGKASARPVLERTNWLELTGRPMAILARAWEKNLKSFWLEGKWQHLPVLHGQLLVPVINIIGSVCEWSLWTSKWSFFLLSGYLENWTEQDCHNWDCFVKTNWSKTHGMATVKTRFCAEYYNICRNEKDLMMPMLGESSKCQNVKWPELINWSPVLRCH